MSSENQTPNDNDSDSNNETAPTNQTNTTEPAEDFPALTVDPNSQVEDIMEVRGQWIRYNSLAQKDVFALASDYKCGLFKSVCACVKVKTLRAWKENTICKAHIFVSKNKVKSLDFNHTCTDQHQGRKRNYNSTQLTIASEDLQKIPQGAKRTRREATQQLMNAAESMGLAMNPGQAYKAILRLSVPPVEVQIGEFCFLPSIFKTWRRADPEGTYLLDTIQPSWKPNSEQFQRYYVAPSYSKHAWKHGKINLVISDAGSTAASWVSFKMSMMLATTFDGLYLARNYCLGQNDGFSHFFHVKQETMS